MGIGKQIGKLVNRIEVEMRMATMDDFDEIRALYDDFNGENMQSICQLDKSVVSASIIRMIETGAIIVPCIGDKIIGFIAGYIQNCHFSNDVMFTLMYFYIHPNFRDRSGAVMKALEVLIEKNTSATMFVVSCPAFDGHEKMERYYSIAGMEKLETHFYKRIKRK